MKTRAAIAWEPNRPLEIEEIDLEGPKDGEVLVRIVTTSLCHTDVFHSYQVRTQKESSLASLVTKDVELLKRLEKVLPTVTPGDHVIPLIHT